jgi:uncharacterized protein with HEPN domain
MTAPRDYPEYLKDMLLEAQLAQEFLAGVAYEDYLDNLEKQRAVIRSIEVNGEAARNIPKPVREEHPEVERRDMIGMRDQLIHGYLGVDPETDGRQSKRICQCCKVKLSKSWLRLILQLGKQTNEHTQKNVGL